MTTSLESVAAPAVPSTDECIGGIPAAIFTGPVWASGLALTANRNTVEYNVSRSRIWICDTVDPSIQFEATVEPYGLKDSLTLDFNIYTKHGDGTHHADFRARRLTDAALEFFRRHHHQPITRIGGRWFPDSDNCLQYEAIKLRLGGTLSQIEDLAAANSTWTGRLANAHEFYATRVGSSGVGYWALFVLGAPNYQFEANSGEAVLTVP